MQSIKNFFARVWLSMTDPGSFKELLKKRFSQGAGYLYAVLVLTSLMALIPLSVILFTAGPNVGAFITSIKGDLPTLYPPDLVVTVKNGEVSTNKPEPYAIDLPPQWQEKWMKTQSEKPAKDAMQYKHLVTIDTSASAEDYARFQSYALITRRNIIVPDKDGSLRIQPIKSNVNMIINRQKYDDALGKVLPYLDYLPSIVTVASIFLLVLAPFIVAGVRLVGYFLYLLITSLLLFWIGLMMKKKLIYRDIYVLSFYGLTLPVVIGTVLYLVFPLPLVFTLIFFVWMSVVMGRLPSTVPAVKKKAK